MFLVIAQQRIPAVKQREELIAPFGADGDKPAHPKGLAEDLEHRTA